jgi:hypothetical protein
MKKILVVYNCCGIAKDNWNMWESHLNGVINQSYENFDICISGCRISDPSKERFLELKKNSNKKIYLNFIEDTLPVNVTFNKSCIESSKLDYYDAFMYLASDVNIGVNLDTIKNLSDLHFSDSIGITSGVVNFDSGIEVWLGNDIFNNFLNHSHYEIPVGKTLNLHCMIFDRKIFESYNERIIPDIFRTYCTESVFSFITASLNLKFMIHNKNVFVTHLAGQDGSSVGFGGGRTWTDLFNSKTSVHERLMSEEAKSVGFGYEEYINVFIHDHSKYNEDNTHKNPKELFEFNKKSLFLSEDELDYNTINFNIIS